MFWCYSQMINCSVNYNLLTERKDNIISKEYYKEIFHNNQGNLYIMSDC